MTGMDDDLTPDEREALGRLPRESAPPPALEDVTVAALARRRLLRRTHRTLPIRPWLAIAASLLLFLGGLAIGRQGLAPQSAEDGRSRFALFLYEGPEYDQPAPEAMAQRVREYAAWATNSWKPKPIALPLGCPNSLPFQLTRTGRCTRPSFHAGPSSSGVTATGLKLVAGFA